MDLSLILTIGFGVVSVVAFIYAMRESRKAKKAENRIIEIENAVVSYKFLKQKAYEYYDNSRYEDSLDVFKKYFLGNKDEKDWIDVILNLYRKETEKLFGKIISIKEGFSATILIITYIMNEKQLSNSSPYPGLIKELIDNYKTNFKKDPMPMILIIAMFDKDWKSAIEMTKRFAPFADAEMNEYIQKLLTKFFILKIPTTTDDFTDDIPF
jgi:hypothetical protein